MAAGVGWIAGKHENVPHGDIFAFASFPNKRWEKRVTETRKHATCRVLSGSGGCRVAQGWAG